MVQSFAFNVMEVFCAYPSDAYASPNEQTMSINSNFIDSDIFLEDLPPVGVPLAAEEAPPAEVKRGNKKAGGD
jgi:hypothetical protein